MREIREIVSAYVEACNNFKSCALATVVEVEGSAYRRPGARMLVTEDGELTGAISGGCLEGDALKKALHVMREKKSRLVKYDTSDEDNAVLGVGLGCNGIIHILIEPVVPENENNPLNYLQRFLSKRQYGVLVTIFNPDSRSEVQPGTCLFLTHAENSYASSFPVEHSDILLKDANDALETKVSGSRSVGAQDTQLEAFVEVLKPSLILNIAGAGNDVIPLAKMAAILGWEVNIIDGRPNLLSSTRFPNATRLIKSRPEEILKHVDPDENSAFVLMTHNYRYDYEILRKIIQLELPYIGVLGPKKKLDRILDELENDRCSYNENDLLKVHGPAGLDLGAETSEEIALSIISEIKAVLAGASGASLKLKEGPIHAKSSIGACRISEKNKVQELVWETRQD